MRRPTDADAGGPHLRMNKPATKERRGLWSLYTADSVGLHGHGFVSVVNHAGLAVLADPAELHADGHAHVELIKRDIADLKPRRMAPLPRRPSLRTALLDHQRRAGC